MKILYILCVLLNAYYALEVNLKIKNGPIFGTTEYTLDQKKPYYAFKGIPFAKPPVGDLRFAEPVPAPDWVLPLNATVHGNKCIQYGIEISKIIEGSEDCLFINVYTPAAYQSESLPVMVWIYGGYFISGHGNSEIYGPDYILEEDVVVVTFNYRLGIYGFLSTEDSVAFGNWGLKDQILALHWVQENIKYFGGNPQSVTLFGQSAGSASASYLSQTPLTEGLFHRAIFQSGTSLNLWAFSPKPKDAAFAIGNLFGIVTNNSTYLVSKLRSIDAIALYVGSTGEDLGESIFTNPRDGIVFGPSRENDFSTATVVGKSHNKLLQGHFHKIPYIIGFNSMEAILFENVIGALRPYLITYDLEPKRLIPRDMNADDLDNATQLTIAKNIKTQYMGIFPVLLSDQRVVQFITDDQFVRPIHEAVKLMSQYSSVYFYRLSYMGSLGNKNRVDKSGVQHGEDVRYLFEHSGSVKNPSEQDLLVRKRMVKMWTNFAKFSNPTPFADKLMNNTIWKPVMSNNVTCLDIDNTFKLFNNKSFNDYNIEFWYDLYKNYSKGPFDTY